MGATRDTATVDACTCACRCCQVDGRATVRTHLAYIGKRNKCEQGQRQDGKAQCSCTNLHHATSGIKRASLPGILPREDRILISTGWNAWAHGLMIRVFWPSSHYCMTPRRFMTRENDASFQTSGVCLSIGLTPVLSSNEVVQQRYLKG